MPGHPLHVYVQYHSAESPQDETFKLTTLGHLNSSQPFLSILIRSRAALSLHAASPPFSYYPQPRPGLCGYNPIDATRGCAVLLSHILIRNNHARMHWLRCRRRTRYLDVCTTVGEYPSYRDMRSGGSEADLYYEVANVAAWWKRSDV